MYSRNNVMSKKDLKKRERENIIIMRKELNVRNLGQLKMSKISIKAF